MLLTALSACDRGSAKPAQSGGPTGGEATARELRQDSVVRALVIRGTPLVLDSSLTLDSVQRILGKTTLIEPSNEHGNWSICYTARDSIGPFMMRFQSSEMGGADHDLLGFELIREPTSTPEARSCASLGVVNGVTTDNGLHLGMPVAALLKVMGRPVRSDRFPPVRSEGVQYSFRFHERVTDSMAGQARTYNVDGWLTVKAANGRVDGLFAWHGETM
jgi:hypothetical protein